MKTLPTQDTLVTNAPVAVLPGILRTAIIELAKRFPEITAHAIVRASHFNNNKKPFTASQYIIVAKLDPTTGELLLLGPRTGKGPNFSALAGGALLSERLPDPCFHRDELYRGDQGERAAYAAKALDEYFAMLIRDTKSYLWRTQLLSPEQSEKMFGEQAPAFLIVFPVPLPVPAAVKDP